MNSNIINFYFEANKLKNVIRTGWKEVGIPKEEVETVAEHICGTLLLAVSIIDEKKLDLNVEKVLKMILVKELAKAASNYEQSIITSNTKDNYKELTMNMLSKLSDSSLVSVYDEYETKESEESKFVYKVCKLESDLQAKIYEKEGLFTIDNAIEDIKNYPEDIKSEVGDITKASDGWITFDRSYYDDELFMSLSKDIQEL